MSKCVYFCTQKCTGSLWLHFTAVMYSDTVLAKLRLFDRFSAVFLLNHFLVIDPESFPQGALCSLFISTAGSLSDGTPLTCDWAS